MPENPIPALYSVYILQSTVRRASLYIGSTPNPSRRLKQHNGEIKGGANRTSRTSLRPWEMVALVSGFPSTIAALRFEWALNNPHITTYIPQNMRISKAAGKRRDGKPKRPPKSLAAILANLDILLHVSAFSRWPLKVHFFSARVFDIWNKTQRVTDVPLREDKIILDYRPVEDEAGQSQVPWGIRALPLAYSDMKEYIAKTKNIFKFEEQKNCLVCGKKLEPEHGIYAACSYAECNGIGHLKCWSQYLLGGTEGGGGEVEHILPLGGKCPSCHHNVHWGLMMKELSLRLRGQAEIEKLFKKQHKKRTCEVQDDEHDELSNVEDRAQEADESDEMDWEADLEWDDIPRG